MSEKKEPVELSNDNKETKDKESTGRGKGKGGGRGRGRGGRGQGKSRKVDPAYQEAMSKAEYQLLEESTWTADDLNNAIEEKRYVINSRTGRPYRDISWTVSTTKESDEIKIDGYTFSRDRFFRNPSFRQRLEEFYTKRNLEFRMKPVYPRQRSSETRRSALKWVMTFNF